MKQSSIISFMNLDLLGNPERSYMVELAENAKGLGKKVKGKTLNPGREHVPHKVREFAILPKIISASKRSRLAYVDIERFASIEPIKMIFDLDETLVNAAPLNMSRRIYIVRSGLEFLMRVLKSSSYMQSFILSNANQPHVEVVHSKVEHIGSTFRKENIKGKGPEESRKSLADLKLAKFKNTSIIIDDTYKNWHGSLITNSQNSPSDDCFVFSKRFISKTYMHKYIDKLKPYNMYGFIFKDKYMDLVCEFCHCARSKSENEKYDVLECNCQGSPQLPYLATLFESIERKYLASHHDYPLVPYKYNLGKIIASKRKKLLLNKQFFLYIANNEITGITKLLIEKMGGKVIPSPQPEAISVVDAFDYSMLSRAQAQYSKDTKCLRLQFIFDTFFNFYANYEKEQYRVEPPPSVN